MKFLPGGARIILAACLPLVLPRLAAGLLTGDTARRNKLLLPPEGRCGPVPAYDHAQPKEFEDGRKTFYNATSKLKESVNFAAGELVAFKCRPGFTTDGSKEGNATFDAECTEQGYFKARGVCLQASKCGGVPKITHAGPTGKVVRGKAEFACAHGYSLDGKKVVPGGHGTNQLFELACIEFSGQYEEFKGECKAYAFMPGKETTRLYNKVTEALFVVSCRGTLQKAFAKGEAPAGLDTVCEPFRDSSAACQALAGKIKSDFTAKLQARVQHDAQEKKDWHEEKNATRPGIKDEAHTFCSELWKILALPAI